jgi:hypothetical protein
MAWKQSISWLASGAAAAAGLVWTARFLRRAPVEREEWDTTAAPSTEPNETPQTVLPFPDDIEIEEDEITASSDARRDIGEEPIHLDSANDPDDVDLLEGAETVRMQEHVDVAEDAYDAVDSDDLGAEWLHRATGSDQPERVLTPEELLERAVEEAARRGG